MNRRINKHKYIYEATCKTSVGFLVKIPFKKTVIQKWFLNNTNGGKRKALNAAKVWRDETMISSGKSKYGKANSVGKGLYGNAGIVQYTDRWKKRLKNGKLKHYKREIIKVTGARLNGKLQCKKLNLSWYDTFDDAYMDAVKIREEFIRIMNKC